MTAAELAQIRARAEAATSGPWKADTYDTEETELYAESNLGALYVYTDGDLLTGGKAARLLPADAAFIAHAREDVPALLAEVERLTETLRRVVVDFADRCCDHPETCDCSMAAALRMVAQ